jgi:hypothetical protein
MNRPIPCVAVAALFAALALPVSAAPLGTAFTYQGELRDSGQPANGAYDFEFRLYTTQAGGGAPLGPTVSRNDVVASGGRFATELDFGNAQFAGDAQWLEVAVRAGASTGAFVTLLPRQPVTPAPYALGAKNALSDSVTGTSVVDGSLGAADINAAAVQARVSGVCPPGFAMRGVAIDGTVACNDAAHPIDGDGPSTISLARERLLMDGGVPFGVAAINLSGGFLELFPCDDAVCSRRGQTGFMSATASDILAFDAAVVGGKAVAAAVVDGNLNWYRCNDRPCTTAARSVVTGAQGSGNVRMALAADGAPTIVFSPPTLSLALYRCEDPACGRGVLRTIPLSAQFDREVVLRPDGRPLVFFQDFSKDLVVYDCVDATCSNGTPRTLDATGDVGLSLSVAATPGGWLVVYDDETMLSLKGYECTNADCSAGSAFVLAAGHRTGKAVARPGAQPLVTVLDRSTAIQSLVTCGSANCGAQTRSAIGATRVRDLRVRADGRVVILGNSNGDSTLLTCANPGCGS